MPRAATSVATRTVARPERNALMARSRWPCVLLPWMETASKPSSTSPFISRSAPRLVRAKTSVRADMSRRSRSRKASPLAPLSMKRTDCAIFATARPGGVTSTRAASLRKVAAISFISRAMVAENSMVCRSPPSAFAMRRSAWMKPRSSIWSASSRTRRRVAERSTAPRSIRSIRRPGVATRMSTPPFSRPACRPIGCPPTTVTMRSFVSFSSPFRLSAICPASSRVGASTSALAMRGSGLPGLPRRWWASGRPKANVLPVPVCARPSTSRPSSASGMARLWMGVGSVSPLRSRAVRSLFARPSSENVMNILSGGDKPRSATVGSRAWVNGPRERCLEPCVMGNLMKLAPCRWLRVSKRGVAPLAMNIVDDEDRRRVRLTRRLGAS